MKRTLASAGTLLLATLLCVGCTSKQPPQSSVLPSTPAPAISYSNLVDPETQQEVSALLEAHGIPSAQADTLMTWADDFNSRVPSGSLQNGFHSSGESCVDYHGIIADPKETEDGLLLPEANCRLTSYLLLRHQIHTNGTKEDGDTILMFDIDAIDTDPLFSLSSTERSDYISLFSWVPLNGADTLEAHADRIRQAWKERAIQVGGDGVSLITVYLHSPFDDVRFVGHTGVLLETEDGLLFVEKYGPQYPFQATKFSDREELKQYLLSRADLYGDDSELPPILMENDQVLS